MHRHPDQPKTVKRSAAAARQQQQQAKNASHKTQESDTDEFEAEAKQHSG
jgi:hypothetical protein